MKEIPFVKPVRHGNFKLWRSKKTFSDGKNKSTLDMLNISDLDGSWMVRIPSTVEMYNVICSMYASEEEEVLGALSAMINNMYFTSMVSNGYFHQGVNLCAAVYAEPYGYIKSGKMRSPLEKSVKALVKAFWEWRKKYDEMVQALEPSEDDMRHDQMADELLEEFGGAKEKDDEKAS